MSQRLIQETRPCTPVFLNGQQELFNLTLVCRALNPDFNPTQKLFKANLRMRRSELENSLIRLQNTEIQPMLKPAKKKKGSGSEKGSKLSRKEEVNVLRENIVHDLISSEAESYTAVARRVGCHPSTVKPLYMQLLLRGYIERYTYNNQHSPNTVNTLDHLIRDPANQFLSTIDYKRRVPVCSKKYIRKSLKATGLKYKKLERQRKVKIQKEYDKKQLKRVIWTAVQAMARDDETILFLDEVKFPCYQTTDYCWVRKGQQPIYNRRDMGGNLHVIALCSQRGFVAFQVHSREPNKEAIHFFLSQVLQRMKPQKKVVILLDNAGWHVANLVMESHMSRVLLFNVAYCWESNMIENTFSKMKSLWRQRRVAKTFGEEVETLLEMFRRGWTEGDFAGYRRQYYRQLEGLLTLL